MFAKIGCTVLVSIAVTSFGSRAQAQYVLDTAFCLSIHRNQCSNVVPDGSVVSLRSLPLVDGHRTLYFWANLRAASSIATAIAMVREGPCYKKEIKIPQDKFERNPTALRTMWAYVSSIRMADILEAFEINKASGEVGVNAGVDAKLNVAIVPEANRYRVHDFRFLTCPGAVHARVLDSAGEPIPGANIIKSVRLVE